MNEVEMGKLMSLDAKKKCLECEVEFIVPTAPTRKDRKKYCSKRCREKGSWKLGIVQRANIQRGRGENKSYTKYMGRHEHRVVMESILGRRLESHEIVHHKDGNKKNNAPDNLELTNRSEHARHHNTKHMPICIIDRCVNKHFASGYCSKHYWQIRKYGEIYVQDDYSIRVTRIG